MVSSWWMINGGLVEDGSGSGELRLDEWWIYGELMVDYGELMVD